MPEFEKLVVFVFLGIILISSLVVWVVMKFRHRPLSGVDVDPGCRWKLGIVARPGRTYRLCHRFHVQFNGPEDGFGLVADYALTAAGKQFDALLSRARAAVAYELTANKALPRNLVEQTFGCFDELSLTRSQGKLGKPKES